MHPSQPAPVLTDGQSSGGLPCPWLPASTLPSPRAGLMLRGEPALSLLRPQCGQGSPSPGLQSGSCALGLVSTLRL